MIIRTIAFVLPLTLAALAGAADPLFDLVAIQNNPLDAKDPKNANLTRLAVDQMRGITYLTTRAEVDKDRIGVGGSSYGGFFATLIAGADPRVKAGMSYFAAGNQRLGTNLPGFTTMKSP